MPNTPNARLKGASTRDQAKICIEESSVWLHAYELLLPSGSGARDRVREMQEDLKLHYERLTKK